MFGFRVTDIEIVAAFDVAANKVGKPIGEAIFERPNCTLQVVPRVGNEAVVLRGPTMDGWGAHYPTQVTESLAPPVDIAAVLTDEKVDVLVSFLPVGSRDASAHYAEAALAAGSAFVNCVPVFLASAPEWAQRFKSANLPIVGDDVKSQVGATIVHRALASLFDRRGATVEGTYQVNVGGNMDFLNMTEPDRVVDKLVSKVDSVAAALPNVDRRLLHAAPGGYIPWLEDRKVAFVRVKGLGFAGSPLDVEVRLDCWDSPNSAGVVVDAIRSAAAALRDGIGGSLLLPSAALMKRPPRQMSDDVCLRSFDDLVGKPIYPAQCPTTTETT